MATDKAPDTACPTCDDKRVMETPFGNTTAAGHVPMALTPCPDCGARYCECSPEAVENRRAEGRPT